MQSKATDKLDLSVLPLKCDKFTEISLPLVGVRPVIEAGNTVLFDEKKASIRDNTTGKTILEAHYDPNRRLYMMPLHDKDIAANAGRALHLSHLPPVQALACAIKQPKAYKLTAYEIDAIPNLIKYLHAAAGYPAKRTWVRAIKRNYYTGWPGLTAKRVQRHLGPCEHTTNGHMKLVSQGTKSTTKPPRHRNKPRSRSHALSVKIIPTDDVTTDHTPDELSGLIGTDLPGRYPITSARGHKYIFVLYDEDANYIHAEPIQSRSQEDLVGGFKACYKALTNNNFKARVIRLDNETSALFKDHIENVEQIKYQLVPPHDHRTNPCERAIQTFKNHFIAMLSGADPTFPTNCWDLLVPQANITLNLLRRSTMQPKLSAYAQIHGQYDFNKTPLAPAGCLVKVYENTNTRRSWAYHAREAFYTRPAMSHYRCYTSYDSTTKHESVSNTVQFFPKQCPLPATASTDRLHMILQDLTDVLRQPHPATPFLEQGTAINTGVRRLLEILTAWTDIGPRVPTREITTLPDSNTSPHKRKIPTSAPRVKTHTTNAVPRVQQKPHQDPRITRTTRSNSIYAIGTIVRKRFADKRYYEGEVTKYDYINNLYTVTFAEGVTEEYTHADMKRHYKQNQVYSGTKYGKALTAGHDTNFDYSLFPSPKQARKVTHRAMAAGGTVWDEELNKMAHYRDLIIHPNPTVQQRWLQASCNEYGRLFQGYGDVKGMDVLEWIPKHLVPKNKTVTYARYTVAVRPEKDEKYRCRITGGGDRLTYDGDVSTHTSSLETFKLLLNSTISTKGAKMATGDISNMYLYSFLDECEFVRFKVDQIPPEIITHYQQENNIHNGFLYAKVKKAWYGLKQSGKIAHDDLVEHLAKYGYKKLPFTEGLFKHETRDIAFSLVVDDFAIKYIHKEDADHLIECMGAKYPFKVDWEAKQYIGIHLEWNYEGERSVILSMPNYVQDALEELKHTVPTQHTYGPSHMEEPAYGQKIQYAKIEDDNILSPALVNFIQRTTGKFLYYARAIDNTMLHALNNIASSKNTAETMKATKYFLNYAACNPNARIIYRESEMILQGDSDAAYLVCPQARSRAGGYIFVGNKNRNLFNGPILVLARVIKNVMASAAEAEVAALYMNAQELVPMRQCLIELGHHQPPTPLKTDNSTATGILTGTIKQKRSKAIDMRFYWLKDRVKQKQFDVYWEPGLNNLADYTTKHHSGNHHKRLRPIQLYETDSPKTVQGCIKLLNYKKKKQAIRPAQKALTVTWADQVHTSVSAREQPERTYDRARHTRKCDRRMLINNQREDHLMADTSTSQRRCPQKILTQPLKLNSRTTRANARGAIQRLFHSTHIF